MALGDIKNFLFRKKISIPDGLWIKCNGCGKLLYRKAVEERLKTCPECNFHFPLTAQERIKLLFEEGSFTELWSDMQTVDILGFSSQGVSYLDKIKESKEKTGMNDAIVTGYGFIGRYKVAYAMTDSRFMMGSMGSVVGEKVSRITEFADKERLPLVIVSGSGGGARMYEGVVSLMQMAKTAAVISRFKSNGGLYISILTNPTMAGVLASFAGLGDITIAEPKALIGFTGPRVIAQTIKQELPEGFQTSEFLLEHGFIDLIVNRPDLKNTIIKLLGYFIT